MGLRKTTPGPGLSAARHATTNSIFPPAFCSAASVLARPPGRSAISPAHTLTLVTVYAISPLLLRLTMHNAPRSNLTRQQARAAAEFHFVERPPRPIIVIGDVVCAAHSIGF